MRLNLGNVTFGVESNVEVLMRRHAELLEELKNVEDSLAGLVTDKVTTPYGTAEWKSSVRYDNAAIVNYLENMGTLTEDIKGKFVTYDFTAIVNYFKMDKSSKAPFEIRGDRKLSISHKKL
jgi:hypothetical protein